MSDDVQATAYTDHRYLEEGEALQRMSAGKLPDAARRRREAYDVIVIGAGQAGLSMGYYLARAGLRFLVLDAHDRVGDAWRQRWDSLHLFSPARYDGLHGMPFPGPPDRFPGKDEMADYLEAYATRFGLPVQTGTRVTRLSRDGERYVVTTGNGEFEAAQVVVAMADYQQPKIPGFAPELNPGIVQLHSGDYRNPSQLQEGPTLVVGAGNSGAEIAKELSGRHQTWLSGRRTGQLPFRIDSLPGRTVLAPLLLRLVFHRLLTIDTRIGRKARPVILSKGGPLIRTKSQHLAAAGVRQVPRMAGTANGRPRLEDGRVLDVTNVIWCTGLHPGFAWIDVPVLGESGKPRHTAGVADDAPGLYFVGLHFLYALTSVMIHGVGRDAARIAGLIAARHNNGVRTAHDERATAAEFG